VVTVLPVRALLDALDEAIGRSRVEGAPSSMLVRVRIAHGTALLGLRVPTVAAREELVSALHANAPWKGSVRREGGVRAVGAGYEADVTFRFFPPDAASVELAPTGLPSLPLAAVREHAAKVDARLHSVSAQQVDRDAAGEVTSADFEFSVPDAARVRALVAELDRVPGVRAVGLEWRRNEKGGEERVALRLSMRR
jgi:hypothetical protein